MAEAGATAFPRLELVLAAATPGDEVWVAAGRYGPIEVPGIVLPEGVGLYGGFAGTETERDQRDPLRHATILLGNGLTVRGITIAPDAGGDTRLDGFDLRNGRAREGGGVYCKGGAPVIANNIITANAAIEAGGGIYCEDSAARIVGNAIYGNRFNTLDTLSGGGIYVRRGAPVIEGNRIYGNLAGTGGGICCQHSTADIRRNLILANRASLAGGGGIECIESRAVIAHNRIIGNVLSGANVGAGGLVTWGTPGPRVENNLLAGNMVSPVANRPVGYAALWGSSGRFYHNTILRSWAPGTLPAVQLSGEDVVFANNLVAFNSAGVAFEPGVSLRRNCAFGHPGGDFRGNPARVLEGGNLTADPSLVINELTAKAHLLPDFPLPRCRRAGRVCRPGGRPLRAGPAGGSGSGHRLP